MREKLVDKSKICIMLTGVIYVTPYFLEALIESFNNRTSY